MNPTTSSTESSLRSCSTVAARSASRPGWVRIEQLGLVALAVLGHAPDAGAVLGERPGDPGQDSGAVQHPQVHEVRRRRRPHGQDGELGVRGLPRPGRSADPVARGGHDVAEDGTGGRGSPGTSAVEHHLARGVGLDEHGVEGVPDTGQRVGPGDQRGVHPDAHASAVGGLDQLGDRQQLDVVAHLVGGRDVLRGDGGDALDIHVGQRHAGVEGDRGQDRRLRGGIETLDVSGRVGLGVPERLRLGQGVGERGPGGLHLGQDVVGGPVHDAQDPADPVTGQRLAQGAQQRDRPGHGGLVGQVDARLHGGGVQGRSLGGDQRLVRGDHRRPALERPKDQLLGRLDATHQLDHEIRIGVQEGRQVRAEELRADPRALAGHVPHAHAGHDQPRPDTSREVVGLLLEQPHHLGSHGPAAEHDDGQLLGGRCHDGTPCWLGSGPPRWTHAGRVAILSRAQVRLLRR